MRLDYGSNLLIKPLFSYFFSSIQKSNKALELSKGFEICLLYFFFLMLGFLYSFFGSWHPGSWFLHLTYIKSKAIFEIS